MTTPEDRSKDGLEELDPETVEDLEVEEDADDVRGGQAAFTGDCKAF